jgi:hypothetical protein
MELQAMSDECIILAEDLLGALKKLKWSVDIGKSKTFLKALQIIWDQGRVEELQQRLDGYRQQLTVTVLVALR